MLRIMIFRTLITIFFSLLSFSSLAEERLALLIGNSKYISLQEIKTAKTDSQVLANALKKSGFKTIIHNDIDLIEMREALIEFGRELRKTNAVGVFYYAGHAIQIDGENYLLPIDIDVQDASELSWQAIRLNDVLQVMERDIIDRINIIILDAGRLNTLPSEARTQSVGLAHIESGSGNFISFSTSPGTVIFETENDESLFSKELSAAILQQGLTIEETFKLVRRNVVQHTNGKQVPWDASSIVGMFHFMEQDDEQVLSLNKQLKEQADKIRQLSQEVKKLDSSSLENNSALKCDYLAASPNDQNNHPETWVSYETLVNQANTAIEACRSAINNTPAEPRYKYQLARTLLTAEATYLEAAEFMREAAESYYPPAMNAYGVMLNLGRGVAVDNQESFKWISRAAEKGNIPAMTNLSISYHAALGIKQSAELGLSWLIKAHENGDPRSTIILAAFYGDAHQILNNPLIETNPKLSEELLINNNLTNEFDVPYILSHIYGDWSWKVLGDRATVADRDKYHKKSANWKEQAIKAGNRTSIASRSATQGVVRHLKDIEEAVNVKHPVDLPDVETLYLNQAYLDNLYVVFDWNRVLLQDKLDFGNPVDTKLYPQIDRILDIIRTSPRLFPK